MLFSFPVGSQWSRLLSVPCFYCLHYQRKRTNGLITLTNLPISGKSGSKQTPQAKITNNLSQPNANKMPDVTC